MVWRDAPVQNSKLKVCNGYLRVAQDRWRAAQARELVQIFAFNEGKSVSLII
ncbi:hypothetical protein A2U01_0110388, partial [Trifolium medium]|nr:hypothetical protein [Trifolium medium]